MKNKRTVNRKLLDHLQGKPCLLCGFETTTIGHHLKSKGSGGPDEPWNLMPLCHVHHDQVHKRGMVFMSEIYPKFHSYLKYWGWTFIENSYRGKWIPPQMNLES